jgi:hypothetical protein
MKMSEDLSRLALKTSIYQDPTEPWMRHLQKHPGQYDNYYMIAAQALNPSLATSNKMVRWAKAA